MTHSLTSTQAKTVSTSDLTIYNEIDTITRKIYSESLLGNLSAIIDDGTTMTESTPTITVTGTVSNPTFVANDTFVIAGSTVTLGNGATDGTGLNQAIADINDAAITGVVASKNSSNQLVITYTPTQSSWSLVVGAGTANTALGFSDNSTYTSSTPTSVSYYNAWTGLIDDRKLSYQMSRVSNHFQNQGFNIVQKKNTSTTTTFYWEIYW